MKIKTIQYIDCDDIQELIGVRWNRLEFAQMAENGSYQTVACDDMAIEELTEELEDDIRSDGYDSIEEWAMSASDDKLYANRSHRLYNQLRLISALRERFNITDSILVRVSW